jgi:hypothetical protein
MESEKKVELGSAAFPPAYVINGVGSQQTDSAAGGQRSSRKSKALFGYAVAATTALIVTLVLGGVYYYRSLDVIQQSIQKFESSYKTDGSDKTVKTDIEIDTVSNVVVFRLTGSDLTPGTYAVIDYTKSMTGLYEPETRSCYLIAGIRSQITDLASLVDSYSKNTTIVASGQNFDYSLADNYPISDKQFLPAPMKSACASLPTYWLEPAQPETDDKGIQKRGFWKKLWRGIKKVVKFVLQNGVTIAIYV